MTTRGSIYWNSLDSSGSDNSLSGGDSGSRNYVDPWDLENYAYLRKHKYSIPIPAPVYQTTNRKKTGYSSKLFQHRQFNDNEST